MSIFIDNDTRLVVQGITGRDGSFHTRQMIEYGTRVVAGVTPGKGGQKFDEQVPIFDTVEQAVKETGANTSVIYVPPAFAADAMFEAADAGIGFIVCITEGVPVLDMMRVRPYVMEKGSRVLGPNCPGLLSPGKSKVGIIPGNITEPGPVGLVSRSGTLTYEVVFKLKQAGIGTTTCAGIGGDPINGTSFIDCLAAFEADPEKQAIADRASAEVNETLAPILERLEREPDDTLLSSMLWTEVDGVRLTREEIQSNLKVMIVGGLQATTDLIALALWALLSHPEQAAAVVAA
ncbi:MAG: hypothetical protein ACR2H9_04505, partial [Longimicrobiaceae bacterium]